MNFTLSKLILRSIFIILTTVVAMLLPFFNSVLGLLGALSFWPLTVYFPVTMYMVQARIKRGMPKWILLHGLSFLCFLVSAAASIGSVADILNAVKRAKPFHTTDWCMQWDLKAIILQPTLFYLRLNFPWMYFYSFRLKKIGLCFPFFLGSSRKNITLLGNTRNPHCIASISSSDRWWAKLLVIELNQIFFCAIIILIDKVDRGGRWRLNNYVCLSSKTFLTKFNLPIMT